MDYTKTLKNMEVGDENTHFIRKEYDTLRSTRTRIIESGKMPGANWIISKQRGLNELFVKRTS